MNRVEQGVNEILSKITGSKTIQPHNSIKEDLGIDSFQFIQLVVEIENTLHIQMEDQYLNIGCYTDVASLTAYLDKLTQSTEGVAT